MQSKIHVNTANPQELLEVAGLDKRQADAIVAFRSEHGPIKNAAQLADILGDGSAESDLAAFDFSPGMDTAAEAPGA